LVVGLWSLAFGSKAGHGFARITTDKPNNQD
jgi:hypothetical protein